MQRRIGVFRHHDYFLAPKIGQVLGKGGGRGNKRKAQKGGSGFHVMDSLSRSDCTDYSRSHAQVQEQPAAIRLVCAQMQVLWSKTRQKLSLRQSPPLAHHVQRKCDEGIAPMVRLPTYFISHGGGPWPWIAQMRQMLHSLEVSLARMPDEIGTTPKAILMISGHWEDDSFAIMSSPAPGMVYDYGGFPPETYQIKYPASGAPELARRTADLIAAAGLPARLDPDQGFDHGTFVPAFVMYPKADVPLYQVSLQRGYDPARHFALGRALAPLRDEGVLIVGSGLSYHNLRLFGPGAKEPSEAFDAWLAGVMAKPHAERTADLIG